MNFQKESLLKEIYLCEKYLKITTCNQMRNILHQEVDHALQSLRKLEAVPSKLEL